jgi:class 3 adenylate cyclase
MKQLSSTLSAVSIDGDDADHERLGAEKARRKVMEQLQNLSSHLAGSVVDFLIEEIERKVSGDDDPGVRGDGRNSKIVRNELDDSVLDDTTDYEDDEDEEFDDDYEEQDVDLSPVPQIRGTRSLSSRSGPSPQNLYSRNGSPKAGNIANLSPGGPSARGIRRPNNHSIHPNDNIHSHSPGQQGMLPKDNFASYVGPRNSGSLLSSDSEGEDEQEDSEEAVGEEGEGLRQRQGSRRFDNEIGPSKSISPRDVPRQMRHANSLRNFANAKGLGDDEPADLSDLPGRKIDATALVPRNKAGSSPGRPHSPTRPGLGRKVKSVRNINLSAFERPENVFGRGLGRPGRGPVGRAPGAGRGRGGLASMRANSVKNIMLNFSNKSGEEKDATGPNEAPETERGSPQRGVQRNTSGIRMQRRLEQTTLERTKSTDSSVSNGSLGQKARPKRRKSGNKLGIERTKSGSSRGTRRPVSRTKSGQMKKEPSFKKQFSFEDVPGSFGSSSDGMYARDNITNRLSHDARKQKRIFKTQNALRKLKRSTSHFAMADSSETSDADFESDNSDLDEFKVSLPLPFGIKQQCALLFVDVSGFTALSQALKVEKLSKTINDYFQLIVEQVEAFGGDILKFCGDAIFVSWRATSASILNRDSNDDTTIHTYGGEELGAEKSVVTAAACAAQLIDIASDYKVFDGSGEKRVATLNLHCAIGFGEVVGVHLGGFEDRMEYFIIGDPIKQVADAMELGKMGEVVASPQSLEHLEGGSAAKPKVILTKTNKFSNPKLMFVKKEKKKKDTENVLVKRLEEWELPALLNLQKMMSAYTHAVVVENQVIGKGYGSTRDAKSQGRFTSEAEIRDVFTVFIQPMVSAEVTGKNMETFQVLQTLHDILVLVNKELRRFKGHLRQYTVDDKGLLERV